jgi:hypothetical protein
MKLAIPSEGEIPIAVDFIPYETLCSVADDMIVIPPHANTDKRGGADQAQAASGGEIVAAS